MNLLIDIQLVLEEGGEINCTSIGQNLFAPLDKILCIAISFL